MQIPGNMAAAGTVAPAQNGPAAVVVSSTRGTGVTAEAAGAGAPSRAMMAGLGEGGAKGALIPAPGPTICGIDRSRRTTEGAGVGMRREGEKE